MQNGQSQDTANGTGGGGDSRGSERAQRRKEILDAALALFTQKGYEATTMAEVAAGVSLAVGTLYKFFKDKRDLYQTLVADLMHEFERRMLAALNATPDDPLAGIHGFIDTGTRIFADQLPLIRVYYAETGAAFLFAPAGLEDEAFQSYARIVDALAECFQRGVERGVFVDMDPTALAIALEGVHNAFLTTLVRTPDVFTPEQITAYTKRTFFESMLRN